MKRGLEAIGGIAATALAVLREIFDEAAYARFLHRRGIPTSCEAYGAFRQELQDAKARRPKCC